MKRLLILFMGISCIIVLTFLWRDSFSPLAYEQPQQSPESKELTQEEQDQKLGELVLRLMAYSPKMSAVRKQFIAKTFVRVANDIFEKQEHKEYYALVLAIESRFYPETVASPAGAVGIAQLMPAYISEFGALCGLKDATSEDVQKDYEIGMTIGACLFRSLIDAYEGNVASALLAYNQGKASLSLKQLHSLTNITAMEGANYLARFLYLGETMKLAAMRTKN